MALDSNIALQFQGMKLNDPMDQFGKAMTLSNMGVQNQFMQQKMDEQTRLSTLASNRQKAFAASGGDSAKFLSALGQMGDIEGAQAFQEHALKLQKDAGEIKSRQIKDSGEMQKIRGEVAQFIAAGGTVDHVQQGMQLLNAHGDTQGVEYLTNGLRQAPNATPDQIRAYVSPFIQSNLTAEQFSMPKFQDAGGQLVNVNPNTQFAPINKTQTPESIASNQVAREGHQIQREGQIRADNRAAETNRINAGKETKLTEVQAKGQLYGKRMQASHEIMTKLEGKFSPLAINAKMGAADMPVVGGIAGAVGNTMLGKNEQLVEQAQRDFINATLRQESGAVISEQEFKNGQKQYFPQPGDSKAVLAQKRRNRETAIKAIDTMAGPAGGFSKPVQQTGGIKFLGFE